MSALSKALAKVARKIRRLEKRLSSFNASDNPQRHKQLSFQLVSAKNRQERLRSDRPAPRSARTPTRLRLVPTSAIITPIPKLGNPHPDYVKDGEFYKSREWRQLRYLALRNSKGCECCGAQAKDGVVMHVDHIKPRYKFPHLALCLDNLQVLCEDCNIGKGAWDETDWRAKMEPV